ncbi:MULTISPECIES: SDR family NAD(P)-dependent oxidoreductase [Rhodococcus]|uniref:SDR family NAD(P)-dependent oxidoreductase n=1 Tax=Rhodococcus TaxID=1827 RepID=UPI0002D22C96|nr:MULTISPECIES: SDR family NAD(P)-dependent oxidoreductase [Rhodococcus]MDV6295900.1 SDR family NAD(P)-dependent oxidoreductase [Rhodococcus aetherivorans]QPG43166.1 SDR family oxidoreductase [Rhodococcus sp. M8]CCW12826.1 3-oxoacyl-[acyl-carrier protein] reductase [Rhodococcus aetherivorans]
MTITETSGTTSADLTQRLAGRRVFLTGGGSGIGAAVAHRLAAEGAAVAVTDAREDAAVEVADAVRAAGGTVIGSVCDVGDEASVAAAVEAAVAEFGGLDGVVTCAGISGTAMLHEMDLGHWERILRVNLTGTFLPLRATIPHLLDADGGSIVTVGSVASLVSTNLNTPGYDASKGGVLQLTRSVAMGYADRGIRANCLCPGLVSTGLRANSAALQGPEPEATRSRVVENTALARSADPGEMASVVAFLLSDDASFMTGAAIAADGGLTAN